MRERTARFNQTYREKFGREPEQGEFDGSVTMAEATLVSLEHELAFLRPSSEEDVAYRQRIAAEFSAGVRNAAPKDLPLRFHGASIYESRDIIITGGLSSSVDRLGAQTSMDGAGQVSVTTPDSIHITMEGYVDLFESNCCIPTGCTFVMLPGSQEDAAAGESMLMGNVDFTEEPDRLFAILASPETMSDVQGWAATAGIDPGRVTEYFAFVDQLADLSTQIDSGALNAQDLVPYPLPQQ
jgi:hypothetical protein